MKYYKVKPENDQQRRYKFNKRGRVVIDGVFIANELYTAKEIEKYIGGINRCDVVEISKNKTYWFFGARFAPAGN